MSRKAAREIAMKKLYTQLVSGAGEYEQLLELSGIEEAAREVDKRYAEEVVAGVEEKMPELDAFITQYSVNWSLDRLGLVDLCILRMTLYEMLYRDDVPESSAINEAVELAKRFCDEKSPKFINGILGSVSRRDVPPKGRTPEVASSMGLPPGLPGGEP